MTLKELENKLNEVVDEFNNYKKNHRNKPVIGGTVEVAGLEWLILDKTDKGYAVITKDFIEFRTFSEENNDWRSSSLREYLQSPILCHRQSE